MCGMASLSVPVRRLLVRDQAEWLALFKAYIGFYRAAVPEEVIAATWRRLVAGGAADLLGLVAVDARDLPIGLAHVLFHGSTWSPTCYCYLEDLFVAPARRKQGVGRALIGAVYREADARGATRTYWMTEEGNQSARALYDRVATRAPFVQYRR
jgi:GNAT superfamily N-acetyltransferase